MKPQGEKENEQLLVSIVTPMYNSAKFIGTTIKSVLNQTYQNWELILVDDYSTDDTVSIVRKYADSDSRIKLVEQQKNQGAGVARNIGIDCAEGDFVAFLDADDYWEYVKLEVQVKILEENQWAGSFSWYKNVDEDEKGDSYFVVPKKISYNRLKYNNYILTSSLMVRRAIIGDTRFPIMRKRQDWIFFLEILKKVDFLYCVEEPHVYYRKSSNSLSSNKFKLIKANFTVISDYFYAGNKLKACIHFAIFLLFYFHNKLFLLRKIR